MGGNLLDQSPMHYPIFNYFFHRKTKKKKENLTLVLFLFSMFLKAKTISSFSCFKNRFKTALVPLLQKPILWVGCSHLLAHQLVTSKKIKNQIVTMIWWAKKDGLHLCTIEILMLYNIGQWKCVITCIYFFFPL